MSDKPEDDLNAVLRAAAVEGVLQVVGDLLRKPRDERDMWATFRERMLAR